MSCKCIFLVNYIQIKMDLQAMLAQMQGGGRNPAGGPAAELP
jgi:hypothetical protein